MSDNERETLLDLEAIASQATNQPYPIPTSLWGKQIAMAVYAAGYRKHLETTTEWGVAYPDSNSVDYIGTALYAEHAFDEEEDAHENVHLVRREVTALDVVRTSTDDADGDLEAGGA